jgi:cellulose 1,4-beta-cellobiosidase
VTTTTALSFTDTGLAAATTYAYQVRAFDAAGNASQPASASATTTAQDVQAPTAPGTLGATTSKGRRVDLSWGPASDNVGVAGYRVYRGASQVAQVATLAYRDRPARGTYTYTVRAVDAAGNLGAVSNSIVVTVS